MLHIDILKYKSDGMKQTSPVYSESELFEYFAIGLALRSHGLPLTSGQQYEEKNRRYIVQLGELSTLWKFERNRSETETESESEKWQLKLICFNFKALIIPLTFLEKLPHFYLTLFRAGSERFDSGKQAANGIG